MVPNHNRLIMLCHEHFARERVKRGCPLSMTDLEREIWEIIAPYEEDWREWRNLPAQQDMMEKRTEELIKLIKNKP